MKEIEEVTNKWKDNSVFIVHGLEELMLLKCPHYPKQSTDLIQFLSKFKWQFSQKQNRQFCNSYRNTKEPR